MDNTLSSMNEYERALTTMGESGVVVVDALFRLCVVILVDVASLLGISYEALNIWLFVIIQPGIIIYLVWRLWKQKYKTSSNG
jgi:Flp pilus assembly protein TadB